MTDTEDFILDQYKVEFLLFDIDLDFSQEAIEYVSEVAENSKTGARALVSVWESILTDFQFELPGSNFKKLELTREICERPHDMLLKMLEKSPFVDFTERFRKEYGIEIILSEEAQSYIEEYARQENMEVSVSIKQLLAGVSALNYMNLKAPYRITREMLEDPKYFDKLFTSWHENELKQDIP
jgi:hypothetical protein